MSVARELCEKFGRQYTRHTVSRVTQSCGQGSGLPQSNSDGGGESESESSLWWLAFVLLLLLQLCEPQEMFGQAVAWRELKTVDEHAIVQASVTVNRFAEWLNNGIESVVVTDGAGSEESLGAITNDLACVRFKHVPKFHVEESLAPRWRKRTLLINRIPQRSCVNLYANWSPYQLSIWKRFQCDIYRTRDVCRGRSAFIADRNQYARNHHLLVPNLDIFVWANGIQERPHYRALVRTHHLSLQVRAVSRGNRGDLSGVGGLARLVPLEKRGDRENHSEGGDHNSSRFLNASLVYRSPPDGDRAKHATKVIEWVGCVALFVVGLVMVGCGVIAFAAASSTHPAATFHVALLLWIGGAILCWITGVHMYSLLE